MTNATVEDWSKELLKLQRTMFDKWIEVTPMAAGMKALNVKGSVEALRLKRIFIRIQFAFSCNQAKSRDVIFLAMGASM